MAAKRVLKRKASLEVEQEVRARTRLNVIAGIDEAGRGALAGPVVAAAVILPLDDAEKLAALGEINDSKQVSADKRARFATLITTHALAWGIGCASSARIDREGILSATRHAMLEAIHHLALPPDYLLIDGPMLLLEADLPQEALVRGDSKSVSIAAASILAKVHRDRYMIELGHLYPQFGFAGHKGYATPQHLHALTLHPPCESHRHTFAPVRQRLL
jgi:ribonuclease HII